MNKLNHTLKYLKYKSTAKHKGGHGIHSPFVYDLLTNTIEDKTKYKDFDSIDQYCKELKQNTTLVNVTDYGAGSKSLSPNRSVKEMYCTSSVKKKYGRLLFRLVKRFAPNNILELGTSIGVSTLYMAKAHKEAALTSIEGCPQVAAIAKKELSKAAVNNVAIASGNFDVVLPKILSTTEKLDFVFFDGNHSHKATINYFNQCLPKVHNDTVFVFDDIHWSEEMSAAWAQIHQHPETIATIDLFFFGLVFFRREMKKQHFVINF